MKRSKWALLLLTCLCALALSGCQLALEEREFSRDRFVGVSLILWNGYGYQSDGMDRAQPHEPDGRLMIVKFGTDVDGVPMIGSDCDKCFTEVKNGYHVKDFESGKGESFNLEATLYLCEEKLPPNTILELERVYQCEDGTLYALNGGHKYALSGSEIGQGSLGLRLSENWKTKSSEGLAEEFTVTVNLNVKAEKEVLSASLVELDALNQEIARHELADQEDLLISSAAAWALMEETLADGSIRRTAVNLTDESETITVRRTNDEALCIPTTYRLTRP